MDNIRFLTEVLTTEWEYWLVAKRDEHHNGQRYKDQIFLTLIPFTVRRGLNRKQILLTDLENLRSVDLPNIFFNMDYPPFQSGQSLWNVINGFHIDTKHVDVNKLIVDCLNIESDDIFKYKELIDAQMPVVNP